MKTVMTLALLVIGTAAFAQENTVELLRQNLKTGKVALMTASLPMTAQQADLFWPIYREYDRELTTLGDRRLAVVRKYVTSGDLIDEKLAEELIEESFSIAEDRNDLLKKYYKKVAKTLGGVLAARFVQAENQMLTIIDAQIIEQMPVLKTGKAGAGEKK